MDTANQQQVTMPTAEKVETMLTNAFDATDWCRNVCATQRDQEAEDLYQNEMDDLEQSTEKIVAAVRCHDPLVQVLRNVLAFLDGDSLVGVASATRLREEVAYAIETSEVIK